MSILDFEQPPENLDSNLSDWLTRFSRKLFKNISQSNDYEILYTEPSKVFVGMQRYFGAGVTGTNISSEGLWVYTTQGWRSLMSGDFFFEVSKATILGHFPLIKFGRKTSIAATTITVISPFNPTWLTTASTIRIKAGGDAADTAAGTGAQELIVTGIDENYAVITDTIITAGASASSATTNTYLSITSVEVGAVGSGEVNAAIITIEAVTGGSTQALIPAGEGRSEQLFFHIPAGKTGYIIAKKFGMVDDEGGNITAHECHIKLWRAEYNESSNNNYNSWHDLADSGLNSVGTSNQVERHLLVEGILEKSRIKITAFSHKANAEIDGRVWVVLVDN